MSNELIKAAQKVAACDLEYGQSVEVPLADMKELRARLTAASAKCPPTRFERVGSWIVQQVGGEYVCELAACDEELFNKLIEQANRNPEGAKQ